MSGRRLGRQGLLRLINRHADVGRLKNLSQGDADNHNQTDDHGDGDAPPEQQFGMGAAPDRLVVGFGAISRGFGRRSLVHTSILSQKTSQSESQIPQITDQSRHQQNRNFDTAADAKLLEIGEDQAHDQTDRNHSDGTDRRAQS